MSPDDFALALRALDAPVFLDNRGVTTPLGVEFTATTSDGRSVLVTQLAPALNARVTNPDAFVGTLMRHGYQGAGITESGRLYFLELPPAGTSLATRLAATGPIPAAELAGVAHATIDELVRFAARGDVHGTVTPSTVYVSRDGALALRWPGMAPALRASGIDAAVIAEKLAVADFVAPEVRAGGAFDVHSDIFALGSTLYTALTGRPPFGGRTTATMMAVVLADDGAPVTTVAGTLTAALVRAIENDPADRWRDLEQFRRALGVAEQHVSTPPRQQVVARRGCAGVVMIGATGGLVLWVLSRYIS